MELFLVRGTVTSRKYMNDKDESFEDIRLVRAENDQFAVEKYYKYWEDKNDAYYVSYYVRVWDISGVVE